MELIGQGIRFFQEIIEMAKNEKGWSQILYKKEVVTFIISMPRIYFFSIPQF